MIVSARKGILLFFCLCLFCPLNGSEREYFLPIHIEDNHGGSFYFLAERLDPGEGCHLLLFDEHSDATAVPGSDHIHHMLLQCRHGDRTPFFASLKKRGIIQCFNWIEPLMPSFIAKVTWIRPPDDVRSQKALKKEVSTALKAFTSLVPRKEKNLSRRYSVATFESISKKNFFARPVIVSIDLDYFATKTPEEAEREFDAILKYTLSHVNLKALTIAVSRPYLKSDRQAYGLLSMILRKLPGIVNGHLFFEPFHDMGPDRSLKARRYAMKGKRPPRLDLLSANDTLKNLLLQKKEKLIVNHNRQRWEKFLRRASGDLPVKPLLRVRDSGGREFQGNNISLTRDVNFSVSLDSLFLSGGEALRWFALVPDKSCYNIFGAKDFAGNAPRFVYWREQELKGIKRKKIILKDIRHLFGGEEALGTVRLFAEVVRGEERYRSSTLIVTRYRNRNYPGRLTGLLTSPYVFGGSLLYAGRKWGPDAKFGSDCSGFIIYGRRVMGYKIPYVDPFRLRRYLKEKGRVLRFKKGVACGREGSFPISREVIDSGLLLHFGRHVAALYEDRRPFHVIDKNDLVIHQLEGYPEIIPLGTMKYINRPFDVMVFR